MARLPDNVQLLALALESHADDHGYFLAAPEIVRGACMPFRESLATVSRDLQTLVEVGWVELREHPQKGPIGYLLKWKERQRVDRPSLSPIGTWYTRECLANDSRVSRESLAPEQGTGNREQVSEKDRIGEGGSALKDAPNSEPTPPPSEPPKTPKAELALAPTIKTTVTPPGGRPSLEEVKTQCQLIGMDPKEGEKWWKDREAEGWTDGHGDRIANWKRWLTCARDRVHALPARTAPCNGNGNGNGKSNSKANPAMMGNRRQLSDAEMRAADRLNVKFGYPPIYNLPPRT